MKYKITLRLETPLLVGGKKLGQNYIKSMDYIPGSVIRASFAKVILERCSYSDDSRWVSFKNKEDCKKCKVANLCRNFSSCRFGTANPLNSMPYPITNMRCKYDSSHKNVDTLIYKVNKYIGVNENIKWICPEPGCGERLEKHTGLHFEGRDIEATYRLITKSGINPYMKRSKDGMLYSLDVLTERIFLGNEEKNTEFSAEIECEENMQEALNEIKILRVGAYNTSGFGKCRLSYQEKNKDMTLQELKDKIEKFNNKIKDSSKSYIAFTLLTDAYLGLEEFHDENIKPSMIDTNQFNKMYEKALGKYLSKELKFVMPIAQNEVRRGFDTSKDEALLRKSKVVSKAGSVFVYSTDKNAIDYEFLRNIQEKGIGENTEHGFGKIEICSSFHTEKAM